MEFKQDYQATAMQASITWVHSNNMHSYSEECLCFQVLCTFIAPTGAVAFTNGHFGAGAGPIYLDTVDCTGSESNLTDCFRSFIVSCSSHSEDAGVRCQGELHLDSKCYVHCT